MRLKLIFFTITCFLCIDNAIGQTYNFRHYSEDEGLHQTYIYCISQSNKGLLNLSTGEGFCTFDGNKFHNYNDKRLTENFVTTHYVDSRNIVWLGHSQQGLSYILNGKINPLNDKQIADYKVSQIIGDNKNNIWVSTLGGGLFKVDTTFHLHKIKNTSNTINSFCINNNGTLVAATDNGLRIFKISRDGARLMDSLITFQNKNVKQIIAIDKIQKRFWVSVEGEGIYGIVQENGHYRQFLHLNSELASESGNITCLFSDQAENLWVGLFGEGLRKISFNGEVSHGSYTILKIGKSNGLINQYIQSIYQDEEGNMWFGTFGGGLIEKPVEKFSFYGPKEGILQANIKTLVTDSAGNLWIGSDKGLAVYEKENNRYIAYSSANGFIDDKINALKFDNKGVLWIGTANNGIYRYNTLSNKFENLSKVKKLTISTINCIIQHENKILIGTTEGIYVYQEDTPLVELITTGDGLLHNNVLSLFYDSHNRLWIASHGAPPYYIKEKKITPFKEVQNLNSFNINCYAEDQSGNIWIGTEGDGIFKYDNRGFTNYKTTNGLLSNYCIGIEVDGNNSVWVSHRNGLSEKKNFHKEFNSHTNKTGLLFYENNINAIHKDASGNLWFATSQGIVRYDPDMGVHSDIEPKLFITKIKLNDAVYSPAEMIVKKYGYYSVQIDYFAISLTDPKSIRYKYRMLGIDSTWKSTSLTYADFPRLSDGNYTFQVIACNANGLYSSKPVEVSFTIKPPIWKHTWFYLFVICSVVLVTYIIVYVRIKNLKKVQALLQETVHQKTNLLQKEKEEVEKIKMVLEHKNKDITDSINYAKRLQDSLLPPDHLMNRLFNKKYFILYKPKDIVSGDFYWSASLTRQTEAHPLSLAAVVDCTGHGVPGAFLSIVANDFLKQCTIDKEVKNTNEILDYLNRNVSSNLNQSHNSKMRVKDGMDIAMIAIDYKNLKLYFSGANNPAY
ncbi:MAG: two-component regulator propeller domain-containing protein, partial [Bacteroidia bacterium]